MYDFDVSSVLTQDELQAFESMQPCRTAFDGWICKGCGTTDQTKLVQDIAFWVCNDCGTCQKEIGIVMVNDEDPDYNRNMESSETIQFKKDRDGKVVRGRVSYGTRIRRRYKREFYYKERIAQWCCIEPVLKKDVKDKFESFIQSGLYGCRKYITRGTIMKMCKDNNMCKYKENWKSILYLLKRGADCIYFSHYPDSITLDYCQIMFKKISKRFDDLDKNSLLCLRGTKGKPRHHILHMNYLHRKILELIGIWEFHREFPLLRTPAKIHALDDALSIIFHNLGISFQRTAVVQATKCKIRRK